MLRIHKHSKLVSTRCSSTGWIKYDEQYHLRKPHYPLSCWCYVYIEFWFLCVSTLEFEDTTGAIRIRKSEKNREHIGQKTEEQRTHWPKEKGQTDKQRSTKHTLLLKTLNMLFLARIYQHGNFMEEIKEVRNSKQIVFRMGFVPTWTLTKLDRLCSTFAHIMIFFCSIIEVWCLGSWFGLLQFVVFKMGLHINIRVHIPQALNFKWDFHVFIVTSEVQTIKHFGDLLP
jgi:hypothetical protein